MVATLDFYKDVVAFAKKNDIIILSDLAYAEIYFDGSPPPSVLQVPGAIDVAVEFTSMSKTFSMPGWRMGFAVGNERLISALTRVKSYLDYGAFTPIQVAATAALNGDGADIAEVRERLPQAPRRDGRHPSAAPAGTSRRRPPRCSPGRRSPSRSAHLGSLEFSKLLIEHADVAVAPGVGFGEHGDDYVRIALVENEHRIRQAARNIKRFLSPRRPSSRTTSCRSPRGADGSTIFRPASHLRGVRGTWRKHCASELRASARSAPRWCACLSEKAAELTRQCGRELVVTAVSARDRNRDRGVDLGSARMVRRPGRARREQPTSTSSSN